MTQRLLDYLDLITPLQQELEALLPDGEPTFGGVKFSRWETGAYVENVFNDQYALLGTVEEQYANGAYREYNTTLGYDYTLYGEASGEKTLELTFGPYFDTFLFPAFPPEPDGQPDFCERPGDELPHRVLFSGRHHVVARHILLDDCCIRMFMEV